MSKPTPRPWEHFVEVDVSYNSRTGEKIESRNHWVRGPDKANVAIAARFFQHGEFNSKEAEANAAHIVKCVNMHEKFLALLKEMGGDSNCVSFYMDIRALREEAEAK